MYTPGCGGADGERREIDQPGGPVGAVKAEVREDRAQSDKARWQEYLDNKKFDFREEETDIFYTLSKFDGDCQIDMVLGPDDAGPIEFRFVRDGKTVLSVPGAEDIPFRNADNVVYFAHHSFSSGGGWIVAYDLITGETLWQTRLRAVNLAIHSGYSNEVNLRLLDGVVHVLGHEGAGDYQEILDRKTGERLAYRAFRGIPVSEEMLRRNLPKELR
jgi:hypothetical protein